MEFTDNQKQAIAWIAQNIADVGRLAGTPITQDEAVKVVSELLASKAPKAVVKKGKEE